MHDHSSPPGHPGVAFISLMAALLGGLGHWIQGAGIVTATHLYAAFTPDDLTAWAKALTGAIFMLVNTVVGCWNLVALARGSKHRRKAHHDDAPPAVGPAVGGDAAPP